MKEEEKTKTMQEQDNNDTAYEEFENEVTVEYERRSDITKEKRVKEKNYSVYVKSSIARPLIIPKFPSLKIIGDNITISKNIDKNIINVNNEVITQNFKIPNFPFLALRTERKPLDSQIYLAKISRKESSVSTVPKININFVLTKLNKDLLSVFKFSNIIPRIPLLETAGDNITIRKNINKTVINEVSIQTFKVPNFPLLTLHVERKPLDNQIYLTSVKIFRKEPSVPTIPKMYVNAPKLVKLDKDVAQIFKFSKTIPKIPSVLISNINMKSLDKQNYLMTIESFRKKSSMPSLPKININFKLVKLNKGVTIVPNEVKIPLPLVLQKSTMEISIKFSDKTIFVEPLLKPENEEISIKDIKNNEMAITTEVSNMPSSILTMLFESDDEKYSVKGLLEVKPDRPVIIVAIKTPDDDYIGTLISILREIYRMKVGGLPIVRYIGTVAEKRLAEDESIRQGFIKVINDSESDILNPNSIDYYKLRDRLIELTGQGFSFLVFYVNENKKDFLLANLSSIEEKIAPAKVIVIRPRKLSAEQKRELARATWGFVDSEKISDNDILDKQFKLREKEFYNILEKIATKREYAEIVKESNEVDLEEGEKESESPLHYQLKVFVVYYLMEKEKISVENIKTEYELQVQGEKIIPDVYIESRKLAIEVETFYGTGLTPWRKLEKTIKKYMMNKDKVKEVWIVIPPLQTMLYLKDLVSKNKDIKKDYGDFIKFYTVDLSDNRLISIEEIRNKLSYLFSKSV